MQITTYQKSFRIRTSRIWNCLADELDLSSSTLASFKSVIFNYYKSALAVSYDCEDPRSFKSICLKCNSARPLSRPITCCMWLQFSCIAVFFNIFCFYFLLVSRTALIGHSYCGVPANVLSLCLFYFGEANKIKSKKNKVTVISGLPHKTVCNVFKNILEFSLPPTLQNAVTRKKFGNKRLTPYVLCGLGERGRACVKKRKNSSSAVIKMTL